VGSLADPTNPLCTDTIDFAFFDAADQKIQPLLIV
jgi:hypothetical protein